MPLANAYVQAANRIPDLFKKIQDGQAPERFTIQLLKDWGFTSTNDRTFIPLLKALNFLTADGKPTNRYLDYRDHSRSKAVLGQSLREAYEDIFLIKEHPSSSDKTAIEGKFKSYHNVSDQLAGLMTKTFLALLPLVDLNTKRETPAVAVTGQDANLFVTEPQPSGGAKHNVLSGLHYNIQIHLPPTKDVEVYNAIFKSLKEHLFDA